MRLSAVEVAPNVWLPTWVDGKPKESIPRYELVDEFHCVVLDKIDGMKFFSTMRDFHARLCFERIVP